MKNNENEVFFHKSHRDQEESEQSKVNALPSYLVVGGSSSLTFYIEALVGEREKAKN